VSEGTDFEPPHVNGSHNGNNGSNGSGERTGRTHPPWEFMILFLFVALIGAGIILAWTLVGSKSPERLDQGSASALAARCSRAQTALKALPNASPVSGADRVTRIRAENDVLRDMVRSLGEVHPQGSTRQAAAKAWAEDWTRVIDARARYADNLESGKNDPQKKFQFVLPTRNANSLKAVTSYMDDYVRESHPYLDACFTQALQLDVVEGPREYKEVHQ
jgi:hypothetical protein